MSSNSRTQTATLFAQDQLGQRAPTYHMYLDNLMEAERLVEQQVVDSIWDDFSHLNRKIEIHNWIKEGF